MALRRIKKELEQIKQSENKFEVTPDEQNAFKWIAIFDGPADSPYEGGRFRVSVNFPYDYPFKPPKMHFITRVYHPNINEIGVECLNILYDQWSPALTIERVLLAYKSLLSDPNPHDPMMPEIA